MNERTILNATREILRQGEVLLGVLDYAAYCAKVPAAFNSSVGGHYRHCLDHFQSVFDGLGAAEVNYDQRKRDARVETIRGVARDQTKDLLRRSEEIDNWTLGCPIRVRSKVSYAIDEPPSAISTVGREMIFCIVHAIHHYALIQVMCGMLGVFLPEGFGVAPSTIKYRQPAVIDGDRFGSSLNGEPALDQQAA